MPIDPEEKEWQETKEHLRAIAERFILAGWCTREIDGSEFIGLGLTEKGQQRRDFLVNALREIGFPTLNESETAGFYLFLALEYGKAHPPPSS